MELRDEEQVAVNKGKTKVIKYALIGTILLMIILIIIVVAFPKKVEVKTTLYINGTNTVIPTGFANIDEKTGEMYISIKDLADLLGYSYYRGEYLDRYTEDTTKCYVDSGVEVSSYIEGASSIYKAVTNSTGRYEYYNINNPVMINNSKLYSNVEGIKIGFNVYASYNINTKRIVINTLANLVTKAKEEVAKLSYGIDEKRFQNRKAVLYDLRVVNSKASNNKYGVVNANGETVIGMKYDSITFSENTREFFVTSSGKAGVLTLGGETKVALNYDSVDWLDTNSRLYLVTKDKFKGVLDRNGKILVHIEHTDIGIDSSKFPKNKIANKYLLYDNAIPALKDKKYGFYDVTGTLIVPFAYDKVGCIISTSNTKSANNALLIEDIDGIIVGVAVEKTVKYGVINSLGELLIPCEFDRIYSITSGAEDIYYLEKDATTVKLDDYIKENNLKSYKNNTLIKPGDEEVTLGEQSSEDTVADKKEIVTNSTDEASKVEDTNI